VDFLALSAATELYGRSPPGALFASKYPVGTPLPAMPTPAPAALAPGTGPPKVRPPYAGGLWLLLSRLQTPLLCRLVVWLLV
jgi:hypothetical protein